MRYFEHDYAKAVNFLRQFAALDRSAEIARIADMLDYSKALIYLERDAEIGPDYMDRLIYEKMQLEERTKRLREYLDGVAKDGLKGKEHMTPHQRTALLTAMHAQRVCMEEYLRALERCMQIEVEAGKEAENK